MYISVFSDEMGKDFKEALPIYASWGMEYVDFRALINGKGIHAQTNDELKEIKALLKEYNMKPALIILAAGMGSRYGGLKQMDGVGPNGETILDYSVYDAIKGGFGKVVFVVRKNFRREFEEKIAAKYNSFIEVEFVEQELDKLPYGYAH